MISLLLALSLHGGEIQESCTKWDGAEPTQCELVLAEELHSCFISLEGSALMIEELGLLNDDLRFMAATRPPDDPLSLFGLPGWLTPVLGGALLAAGVAIGVSL